MNALHSQPNDAFVPPPDTRQRPRIGYDARFSLGEYRGMGRYLRRLVRPVMQESIGFCASGESDNELVLTAGGARFFPVWEQISLPRRVRESGIEFFVAPYNTAPLQIPSDVGLVLVVHDFIYLRSTSEVPLSLSAYQNFGRLYRRLVVPQAVRRADHIIAVSNYTRRELLTRFRVGAEKVTVIPNTIDDSWFHLDHPDSPQKRAYVFCVSGEAPNKNLPRALEAFAAYCRISRDPNTHLRVAGVKPTHHPHFRNLAEDHGIAARVHFLDYVSDFELQQHYANAAAFFFPSCDEGFGIPVLEALSAGVPVVASNASSIPEVAGDAALYFDPASCAQMAEQLRTVLSNPALQRTMSHRGRDRAQRFHPTVVDAAIAAFWKQLLAHA